MLLYCIAAPARRAQATSLVRRQNLISKSHSRTLARPFNSRSPVQQTVILDSSDVQSGARDFKRNWRLNRSAVFKATRMVSALSNRGLICLASHTAVMAPALKGHGSTSHRLVRSSNLRARISAGSFPQIGICGTVKSRDRPRQSSRERKSQVAIRSRWYAMTSL